ncbi:MAG: hypothetical protein WC244_04215, partial [Patescibacteria group bacterium]
GDPREGIVFADTVNGLDMAISQAWTHASIYTVGSAGWNGDLLFATDGNNAKSTGLTEKMRITHDGYIGIGTATPDVKLVVGGGVGDGNIMGINGADNQYTGLRLSVANIEKWFVGMDSTVNENDLMISRNGHATNTDNNIRIVNTAGAPSFVQIMNKNNAAGFSVIDMASGYSASNQRAISGRSLSGWSGYFNGGKGFYVDKLCIGAQASTSICQTSWPTNATPTLAQVINENPNASSVVKDVAVGKNFYANGGEIKGGWLHASSSSGFSSIKSKLSVGINTEAASTFYAYNSKNYTIANPNDSAAIWGKSDKGSAANFVNGSPSVSSWGFQQPTVVAQHLGSNNVASAIYAENYSTLASSQAVYASSTGGWAGYFTGGTGKLFAKQICLGDEDNCLTTWPTSSSTSSSQWVSTTNPVGIAYTVTGGHVGIGTTKAGGALHVNSGTNGKTALFERSSIGNNNTLNEAIRLMATKTTPAGDGLGSSVGFYINDNETPSPSPLGAIGAVMANNDKNTGNLVFRPSNNGYQPVSMIINYLGDVGVGTVSPNSTAGTVLHVKSTGNAEIDLQSGTTNTHWGIYATNDTNDDLVVWKGGNDLLRLSNDGGVASLNNLRINSNGNVGINRIIDSESVLSVNATGKRNGILIEKNSNVSSNGSDSVLNLIGSNVDDVIRVTNYNTVDTSDKTIHSVASAGWSGYFTGGRGLYASQLCLGGETAADCKTSWPTGSGSYTTSTLAQILTAGANASSYTGGVILGSGTSNSLDVGGAITGSWIHATGFGNNTITGKLGIGYANGYAPTESLEVFGTYFGSGARIANAFIGVDPNSTGTASFMNYNMKDDLTAYAISQGNDGTTYINSRLNYSIKFRNNNLDTMILTNAGRLGIGTVTPDSDLKLHVVGNIGATSYCDTNGENCKSITDLSLWATSSSNIYRNSGNVGIGSSTPSTKLVVQGSSASGDGIVVKTDGTASGFVKVFNSSNKGGGMIAYSPVAASPNTNRVGFVSYAGSAGVNIAAQDTNGTINLLTGGNNIRMSIGSAGVVSIGGPSSGSGDALVVGDGSGEGDIVGIRGANDQYVGTKIVTLSTERWFSGRNNVGDFVIRADGSDSVNAKDVLTLKEDGIVKLSYIADNNNPSNPTGIKLCSAYNNDCNEENEGGMIYCMGLLNTEFKGCRRRIDGGSPSGFSFEWVKLSP